MSLKQPHHVRGHSETTQFPPPGLGKTWGWNLGWGVQGLGTGMLIIRTNSHLELEHGELGYHLKQIA